MQVRKWTKPGTDEIRYYISCRFGGAPFLSNSANRLIDGRWIAKGDDGMAHIYTKTQHGRGACRTEDGDWLDKAFLGSEPVTFSKWEATYEACLTKSGNFSVAKYMK